jgi:hypothetical protein
MAIGIKKLKNWTASGTRDFNTESNPFLWNNQMLPGWLAAFYFKRKK